MPRTWSEQPCTYAEAKEWLFQAEPWGWPRVREFPDHEVCIFRGGRVRFRWNWGFEISAPKLVWFMNTGYWPAKLGVRNGNQLDLHFANLFPVGEVVDDLV